MARVESLLNIKKRIEFLIPGFSNPLILRSNGTGMVPVMMYVELWKILGWPNLTAMGLEGNKEDAVDMLRFIIQSTGFCKN